MGHIQYLQMPSDSVEIHMQTIPAEKHVDAKKRLKWSIPEWIYLGHSHQGSGRKETLTVRTDR